MPNTIKYSTTGDTLSIKKGNFYFGTGDVGKGPSLSTRYYNGVSPASNSYTVYLYNANQSSNISFYGSTNDSELITYTNQIFGQNFSTVTQCLNWYATQTNYVCVNRDYEGIVTSGLTLCLDAGFTPSYSTSGVSWYDISYGGNNGTLTNGPTFNSSNGGSIVFDGVDDYATNIGTTSTFSFIQNTGIFTISAWVKLSDLSTARYFMGNNDGTTSSKGFYLGYSGVSGRLWLSITYGVGGQSTLNQTKNDFFTDNNWVLVTCVGNGTNCQFYKNGISFDTPNNFGTFSTGDSSRVLGIGRVNNTSVSNYWSGNVALTQIYNRALSSAEVLQNYNAQKSRYVSSVDPDAQAFITAAGITDPTQQSAINTLVVDLKSDGLWTKMIAIYPLVGGTASSQKYNLKDPRDLDVAYRLTFGGGWSHGSFGIGGNGVNTYADTHILNYNLGQIGAYVRDGNNAYYGGRYALDYQFEAVNMFPYIGTVYESSYQVGYFSNSTDGNDYMFTFDGFLGLTSISGGDGTAKSYYNGSLIANITPSANPSPLPISLWFGSTHLGYNMANPSFEFYSDGVYAFGFVTSSTLDSTENSNLYSIVQAYQTTLGRDV